ncbi:MAG: hypothetical protein GF364_22855 [Candidatus Lokiarchaeota archaeon]|nr:hypothetical protein [Candidatus Lokiarchaeota archaeon]
MQQDIGTITRFPGMPAFPWMGEYQFAHTPAAMGQVPSPSWMPQQYEPQQQPGDAFSEWLRGEQERLQSNDIQARLNAVLASPLGMQGIQQHEFY